MNCDRNSFLCVIYPIKCSTSARRIPVGAIINYYFSLSTTSFNFFNTAFRLPVKCSFSFSVAILSCESFTAVLFSLPIFYKSPGCSFPVCQACRPSGAEPGAASKEPLKFNAD